MKMEACLCWAVQFKKFYFCGFYVFFHLETEAQIVVICSRLDVAEMGLLLRLLV